MRLPNKFDYYVSRGIMRKISIDMSRAEFLIKESQVSLEGLKERIKIIGINDKNANSVIKDCYDIIIEMIRAKLFLVGYSTSGNYAHEAEVSYLEKLGFSDKEISFLNEIRHFRNSITYYGKLLDADYAKKVFSFLEKIIPEINQK